MPIRRGRQPQQPHQILRIVHLRHQRDALAQTQLQRGGVHEAQGGIVFEREADRIELGDVFGRDAPRLLAGQHLPQLGDGKVGRHLLNVALDARLRRVFNKHAGGAQHIGRQFRLARTVPAHGVEVHAGRQHVGRQDGGVQLVGGDGGHDVGAANRFGCAGASGDRQTAVVQVGDELVGGCIVHVVHAQRLDADQRLKRQRLEFALRAVADQRHHAAAGPCQRLRGQGRSGGGAQGGGQRQLGQKQRPAVGDFGQHAKGHHGGQTQAVVVRVAVDVLEAVALAIGHGYQLDHALRRMRRMRRHARGLVEFGPAQKVVANGWCDAAQASGQALAAHQLNGVRHAQEQGAGVLAEGAVDMALDGHDSQFQ